MGDNGLDQVGGHFVHALATATRTESSFFATKRDKPLCLTLLAAQAREPVSQYPAAKISLDLLMNMAWKGFPLFRIAATQSQKGFEVFCNRAVKNRLLRLMSEISRSWK